MREGEIVESEEEYIKVCKEEAHEALADAAKAVDSGNVEGLMILTVPFAKDRAEYGDGFASWRNSGVENNLLLWLGVFTMMRARLEHLALADMLGLEDQTEASEGKFH